MEILCWICEFAAVVAILAVFIINMQNETHKADLLRAFSRSGVVVSLGIQRVGMLCVALGACIGILNGGMAFAEKGSSDTTAMSGEKKSSKSSDKKSGETSATKGGEKTSSETSATKGGAKKSSETSATKGEAKKSSETSATKGEEKKSGETSATKGGEKKSGETSATKGGEKKSSETSATKGGDKKSSETGSTKSTDKKSATAPTKPTGPVSIVVDVAAEETSEPVMLKPGKYYVLSKKSSTGDKQKFGPFALGAGKPYLLEFSGDVTPKIDRNADTSELSKTQTMLSIKNPLRDDYSFKIKEDETDAKKANTHASVIGRWKMGAISGDCIFYANGRCQLTEHDKSSGTWKPIAEKIIKIRWSNGWWTTYNLSEDGKTLYGRSAWGEDTENGRKDWAEKIE